MRTIRAMSTQFQSREPDRLDRIQELIALGDAMSEGQDAERKFALQVEPSMNTRDPEHLDRLQKLMAQGDEKYLQR